MEYLFTYSVQCVRVHPFSSVVQAESCLPLLKEAMVDRLQGTGAPVRSKPSKLQ